MTGPRGDCAPEFVPLGRKIEKPNPAALGPKPAPGIDPGKHIQVDEQGRLSTNIPANEIAKWRIVMFPGGFCVELRPERIPK